MTSPPLPHALLHPNEGQRPSGLALARAATGEAPPLEGPEARAYAEALAEARAALPPFDAVILRAAAARVEDARPAPRPRAAWWALALGPVLALAAMLLAVQPPAPALRAKGAADLDFLVLRGGEVTPGVEGMALAAGDRVQFTYDAAGHDSLVLLSVDGEGTLSVFYPARGEAPVAITPGERRVLEGSIQLDDAPGPELFVAVFGPSDVGEARALVAEAWARGGAEAVLALQQADPALDVVRVEKAEARP